MKPNTFKWENTYLEYGKDIYMSEIKKVGVLGAGMMGAGIAFVTAKAGIDAVLICDNMAASLMQAGKVDVVITGADELRHLRKEPGEGNVYSVTWPHRFIQWNKEFGLRQRKVLCGVERILLAF